MKDNALIKMKEIKFKVKVNDIMNNMIEVEKNGKYERKLKDIFEESPLVLFFGNKGKNTKSQIILDNAHINVYERNGGGVSGGFLNCFSCIEEEVDNKTYTAEQLPEEQLSPDRIEEVIGLFRKHNDDGATASEQMLLWMALFIKADNESENIDLNDDFVDTMDENTQKEIMIDVAEMLRFDDEIVDDWISAAECIYEGKNLEDVSFNSDVADEYFDKYIEVCN